MSKTARDVIADAIMPGLMKPQRRNEVAEAAIGALISAGFVIVPKEPSAEMQEIGKVVIWQSGITEAELGSDALTAADIYRAMIKAA